MRTTRGPLDERDRIRCDRIRCNRLGRNHLEDGYIECSGLERDGIRSLIPMQMADANDWCS